MFEENTPIEKLQESQDLLRQAGASLKILAAADPGTTVAGAKIDRAVICLAVTRIYETVWDAINLLDGVETHLEKEAQS